MHIDTNGDIMKLKKNTFITLMLLLCSTQTHKPMSQDNGLSLSLLLPDKGILPSSTGEENMFTELFAAEYHDYHNPAQWKPLDSITLNTKPASRDTETAAEIPPNSPKKRKENTNIACSHCDHVSQFGSEQKAHISMHFPVTIACPFDNCAPQSRATISSLTTHFKRHHQKDLQDLGKSAYRLAHKIYNSALDSQEGIAHRSAQPLIQRSQPSKILSQLSIFSSNDASQKARPSDISLARISIVNLLNPSENVTAGDLKQNQLCPTNHITNLPIIADCSLVEPATPSHIQAASLQLDKAQTICPHCRLVAKRNSDLKRHLSVHFPVSAPCPFPACEETRYNIAAFSKHFERCHKEDCKLLKKSMSQLASETYLSALEAQGGIAGRTAQPIAKRRKK